MNSSCLLGFKLYLGPNYDFARSIGHFILKEATT